MGSYERNKGKRGERRWRDFLRVNLRCHGARRGQQRSGLDQSDVADGIPGTHPEVKWVERVNLHAALEQATRDAEKSRLIPYVASTRSRESFKVTCWAEHWLALSIAVVRQALASDLITVQDLLSDDTRLTDVWLSLH